MPTDLPDLETQLRQAQEALRMVLAGDTDRGMALYDRCIKGDSVAALPIGVHLLFLEQAGRHSIAGDLRRLTLERGGNLAVLGRTIASDPAKRCGEYEALFAQGIGNSPMIFDYLLSLSRLGRESSVAAITDRDRLLKIVKLEVPTPGGQSQGLASAVQQALVAKENEFDLLDADQSIRKMRKLEGLDQWDDPAISLLLDALHEHAETFRAAWAASDHPLAHLIPEKLRMKAWALISRGEGFNVQHTHSRGWMTGVYYPSGRPDGIAGGELRIGAPAELESPAAGWPEVVIRPEAGLLVMMPSYYPHWTTPLDKKALRTSVAFDFRTPAVRVQSAPVSL